MLCACLFFSGLFTHVTHASHAIEPDEYCFVTASPDQVYPYPNRFMPQTTQFSVVANSTQVPVYNASPFLVTSFAFASHVTLHVTFNGTIKTVDVYPKSLNLVPTIVNSTFTLSLASPAKFQVVINGLIDAVNNANSILYVFSDPPETDVPDPSDPKVYYFDNSQVHTVPGGILQLNNTDNHTSIYLAPGSQLNAIIHAYAVSNFRIYGRGTLMNPFPKSGTGQQTIYIGGSASKNFTVQDINMFGSPWWHFHIYGTGHTINNIKMMTTYTETDALTFTGNSNGHVIKNSFFMNNDNMIVLGMGSDANNGPYNNTITTSTFLKGTTGSWLFMQGAEATVPTAIGANNTITNCDVIRMMHEVALAVNWFGNVSTIANVVIDHVRVDSFSNPAVPANYTPICTSASLMDNTHSNCLIWFNKPTFDLAKSITFQNMNLPTSQASYVANANWTITFKNVSVAGKLVKSDSDLKLTKGSKVTTIYNPVLPS